jgi:hypothetical protein
VQSDSLLVLRTKSGYSFMDLARAEVKIYLV